MPVDLAPAATAVEKRRLELHVRLEELNKAPAYMKVHQARYVAAALFELLHAQEAFNQAVIGALGELRRASAP